MGGKKKYKCNTCNFTGWILPDNKNRYQTRARDYHDPDRNTDSRQTSSSTQLVAPSIATDSQQPIDPPQSTAIIAMPNGTATTPTHVSPLIETLLRNLLQQRGEDQVVQMLTANSSTALVPHGSNHVSSPASLFTTTPPPGSTRLPVEELKSWTSPKKRVKAQQLYTIDEEEGTMVYATLRDTGKRLKLGRLAPSLDSYPYIVPTGKTEPVTLQIAVQTMLAEEERRITQREKYEQRRKNAIAEMTEERATSPGLRFLEASPDPPLWTRDNFADAISLPTIRQPKSCFSYFDEHTLQSDKKLMPHLASIQMACNSELIDNGDGSEHKYASARQCHNGIDHLLGIFLHPRTQVQMKIWVYVYDFYNMHDLLIDMYETEVQRALDAIQSGTLPVHPSPTAYLEQMVEGSPPAPTQLVPSHSAATPLYKALLEFGQAIVNTTNAHATKGDIGITAFNAAVQRSAGTMLDETQSITVSQLLQKFKTFCSISGYESNTCSSEVFMWMNEDEFESALRALFQDLRITHDRKMGRKIALGVAHVNAEVEPASVGTSRSIAFVEETHNQLYGE